MTCYVAHCDKLLCNSDLVVNKQRQTVIYKREGRGNKWQVVGWPFKQAGLGRRFEGPPTGGKHGGVPAIYGIS